MNKKLGLSLPLAAWVLAGSLMSSNLSAGVHVRVYVPAPPPPPVVEVVGVAPGPRHVWIAGYHRWDGRAYVWVPGRWVVRPRARTVWVAGHWAQHRRGWYWVRGHWR
jgi:hypothetical protein